jgi:2-deoxy-D-gluconate 3-dehydrogenase
MDFVTELLGLSGKKALVIGGGQGMGESISTLLARAGADVAVIDLERDRAERVAGKIAAYGIKSHPFAADMLDPDKAVAAIGEAEKALGGFDVLVSIVGQALFKPILEMTLDDWDFDHRRNLRYFFVAGREVAASMIRRGKPGAMACVASADGLFGAIHHASYGAAKAGLIHLVKTMALEWAPHEIRVNAVAPGTINTPRLPETPASRQFVADSLLPMKRAGVPDDIGKALLFLVSNMSPYVTGQTLFVDGGWNAANLFDPRKVTLKSSN